MAEIKSTLDIIMERTKDLVLSPEEKQQLDIAEQLRKIPGFLQKYLDGSWTLRDLREEIEALPDEHRQAITQRLLERLVMELGFDAKGRKCAQALVELTPQERRDNLTTLWQLLDRYDASHRELVDARAEQLQAQLADLGISGSAVLARGEKSTEWEAKRQEFDRQLDALKASW